MNTTILLIDDDERILHTFARTLKLAGYTVFTAENGEEGMALYHQEAPDIILLDLRMPGMNGLEILQAIRAHDPEANVVLATGHGDKDAVIEALRAGASDFLSKPIDQVTLESALRRAEERIHLKRQLRASQEELRHHNLRLEEKVRARTQELEQEIEERKEVEKALRESEKRYKEAERVSHFGSWKTNLATGKGVWSDEFYRICGYEPGSIEATSEMGFKIIHPDDRERAAQQVTAAVETGTPYDIEKRIVRPNGTVRWVRSIGKINYNDQGEPVELVGSFLDITEQKLAEMALQKRERDFSTLIENAADMIVRFDTDLRYTFCNTAVERQLGVPRSAFLGKLPSETQMLPEQAAIVMNALRQVLETGEDLKVEQSIPTPHGLRSFQTHIVPEHDEEGQIESLLAITRDISDHKQLEIELKEANARVRDILESVTDAFFALDDELTVTYFNQAAERLLGRDRDEILGQPLFDAFPEARGSIFEETYRHALREKKSLSFETYFDAPAYENWYTVNVYPRENGISVYFQVITERKQIERQFRFQAQLLDAVGQAVIATDLSGEIIYWNRAAERVYGWTKDEALGRNVLDVTPIQEFIEQAEEIMASLRKGEEWSGEFIVQRRDGSSFHAIVTDFPLYDEQGNLIGVVGITTDISDLRP